MELEQTKHNNCMYIINDFKKKINNLDYFIKDISDNLDINRHMLEPNHVYPC